MPGPVPTNQDDVIDSRDVIARIEELEADLLEPNAPADAEELREELRALRSLAEQAADYAADWPYGEVLIRDTYFQRYAEQLAEDLDLIKPEARWPYTCIDWERAARELRMDYTSVEFDGVDYWIR